MTLLCTKDDMSGAVYGVEGLQCNSKDPLIR